MKRIKSYYLIGLLLLLTMITTACAKKSMDSSTSYEMPKEGMDMSTTAESGNYKDGAEFDIEMDQEMKAVEEASGLSSTSSLTTQASSIPVQDKIIRTFYLDVETQEFDSLITKLSSEINRLEGYVEKSEISGNRYYNSEGTRYGSIVARIPSSAVEEFVNAVDKSANIINKEESTKNVSLEYIEAESRIKTLEIEQERLFAILKEEVSLENIITLESRLSDIRYELQNYQSKLRYYDNQVAYSTVTLSIQEVEKLTPITENKLNVGERIQTGFSDTIYRISEGFKDFFVWFVVNLPYLLIWGIIIAVVVIIGRKSYKKYNAKKDKELQSRPPFFMQNQNQTNNNDRNDGSK